jgi:hypothetical protein
VDKFQQNTAILKQNQRIKQFFEEDVVDKSDNFSLTWAVQTYF